MGRLQAHEKLVGFVVGCVGPLTSTRPFPSGKMSLISQNPIQKRRLETIEADDDSDEGLGSPVAAGAEDGNETKSEKRKKEKKRKKAKALEALEEKENKEREEMKLLESSLFGALYAPPQFGTEVEAVDPDKGVPSFFMDRSGGDGEDDLPVYDEGLSSEDEGDDMVGRERKPAWVDEEEVTEVDISKVARLRKLRKEGDERVISGKEYEARLRGQHAKLNRFAGWADLDRKAPLPGSSDNESDEEGRVDDILRNNDELVVKDNAKLLPDMLGFSRLVDANSQEPSSGPINSVQFHRNGQLMLVAGLDKHLRFFQIDGKRNPKIQSIFIEDCPVHKAAFLPDGSEVILSGRRKFFYSFDLVNAAVSKIGPLTGREEKSLEHFEISPDSKTIAFIGNEGYILLISSKTKQLIGTLKMNGNVRSLAFADGGNQLLSSGGDGHVYHWDLRTRKCIHKGTDEGSLAGISLCTSPDSSLFATGSTSGIVNVYKRDDFLGGKRKPLKTIENLTTEIGEMKFNHDAQVLAISSRKERNGMRLVHVPSLTVFQNWPGPRFSLHYPRCLDFSPGSGFLSVGHAGGKVLLYKLHHYQNA
uniref:U3 small nucleolar RNA-associated protein 18 homolog n=2 Tax=Oryza TaxID=4527 RepID=A0A0E0QAW5_ORYRU